MNAMMKNFKILCSNLEVNFDFKNQHVRCLAHIINLAAQDLLKNLREEAPENENEFLENIEFVNNISVVSKVSII